MLTILFGMMEQLSAHFTLHGPAYASAGLWVLRTLIGTVLVGLSFACIYLVVFLRSVYLLPRHSREFMHKREHIQPEMLARYLITSLCVGTLDALLLTYFDWAPYHFTVGLVACLLILAGNKLRGHTGKTP